MTSFYDRWILDPLLDRAMRLPPFPKQREKTIPSATGYVLEIGAGSGLNLEYYNPDSVEQLWALEPSEPARKRAATRARSLRFPVTFLPHGAERIPLGDAVVDTVVLTYVLCTIPDVTTALAEIKRVLRPDGSLVFTEHGKAPDGGPSRIQNLLNPIWKRLAGGCHLNRSAHELLSNAGFNVEATSDYLPGPRWLSYHTWGVARVA